MPALSTVNGIVSTRHPKDVYRCVRIFAGPEGVTLTGLDGETSIVHGVEGVDIRREGEALVNSARLLSIVRELPSESVSIERSPDDTAVRVVGGQSEFKIQTSDLNEFPAVERWDDDAYISVGGFILREAFRRTVFACEPESTRYALGGVCIEQGGSALTLAASDSRRLSTIDCECAPVGEAEIPEGSSVIPAKAISLAMHCLAGIAPEDDTPVKLALRKNSFGLQAGACLIRSRLVEGRFPKWRQVIPHAADYVLTIPVEELLSCVRQVQLMTTMDARGVVFRFGDGTLSMHANSAEIGSATIEMPIDFPGEPVTIWFDPKYIADVLRVAGSGGTVEWEMRTGDDPVLMRFGTVWRYVLMPLSKSK